MTEPKTKSFSGIPLENPYLVPILSQINPWETSHFHGDKESSRGFPGYDVVCDGGSMVVRKVGVLLSQHYKLS
jgi:hypothetical protein